MNLYDKKESIWTRLESDCDIDELIYGCNVATADTDEKASDR